MFELQQRSLSILSSHDKQSRLMKEVKCTPQLLQVQSFRVHFDPTCLGPRTSKHAYDKACLAGAVDAWCWSLVMGTMQLAVNVIVLCAKGVWCQARLSGSALVHNVLCVYNTWSRRLSATSHGHFQLRRLHVLFAAQRIPKRKSPKWVLRAIVPIV